MVVLASRECQLFGIGGMGCHATISARLKGSGTHFGSDRLTSRHVWTSIRCSSCRINVSMVLSSNSSHGQTLWNVGGNLYLFPWNRHGIATSLHACTTRSESIRSFYVPTRNHCRGFMMHLNIHWEPKSFGKERKSLSICDTR